MGGSEGTDWILVDHDRDQWEAHVNMVTNCVEFRTMQGISRLALFHTAMYMTLP